MKAKTTKLITLRTYLKNKYPGLTNKVMDRALKKGACLINGKIETFATRKIDPSKDKIKYTDIRESGKGKLIIDAKRIIYEDEHMIVYNKEAGHLTLAAYAKEDKTHLHGELQKHLQQRDSHSLKLYPVHRLDKETSGLIIFAKSKAITAKLDKMFADKEVHKEYEALVDGDLTKKHGLKFNKLENEMYAKKKNQILPDLGS